MSEKRIYEMAKLILIVQLLSMFVYYDKQLYDLVDIIDYLFTYFYII